MNKSSMHLSVHPLFTREWHCACSAYPHAKQKTTFANMLAVVLAALLLSSSANYALVLRSEQLNYCPGNVAEIREVRVTPCDELPCQLPQGSTAAIQIQFTPKTQFDSLDVQVFGVINRADVPFRGISRNGCDTLTKSNGEPACPVTDVTETITYTTNVEVKRSYPPLGVGIKFKMNPNITCFSFPAQITKVAANT